MSVRRRQFKEMETLEVTVRQGAIIPCKRCRVAFVLEDVKSGNIQKEHLHELALDGPDEPKNCAFSHYDCHKVITNGNGATTAGSSKNRIAKATQPKRIEKFVVTKPGPQPYSFRPAETPIFRPSEIDPGPRCRGCGEYGADCTCPPRQESSSFRRRT